jgi:hypothetical protein
MVAAGVTYCGRLRDGGTAGKWWRAAGSRLRGLLVAACEATTSEAAAEAADGGGGEETAGSGRLQEQQQQVTRILRSVEREWIRGGRTRRKGKKNINR